MYICAGMQEAFQALTKTEKISAWVCWRVRRVGEPGGVSFSAHACTISNTSSLSSTPGKSKIPKQDITYNEGRREGGSVRRWQSMQSMQSMYHGCADNYL